MDIVLFGIQGSGKGTQAKRIAKKYNMKIFETGGELRKLAKKNSPLGKKIQDIINSGHLVSNEVVMEILENFINQIEKTDNIIFDGIPRSIQQLESFNTLLDQHKRNYKGLLIEITKDEAIKRLLTRKICKKCKTVYPANYKKNKCECGGELVRRADDNEESIINRLNAFETETIPVINQYKKLNKLITIDGLPTIEKVSLLIYQKLDNQL